MDIANVYEKKSPHGQNVLDLFRGEWSSTLPDEAGLSSVPGGSALFEDGRVAWAEEVFGSFAGWNVLELGPLEGGHSYMFQRRKVRQVDAIEANTRAFLKCLCIKELFSLDAVRFKLGDFVAYLEETEKTYDLAFASGVLYHMSDPVRLIDLLSRVSDRLFLWTHYFDPDLHRERRGKGSNLGRRRSYSYRGRKYDYATQAYGSSRGLKGFCGGSSNTSRWLTRDSLTQALENFGFDQVTVGWDEPEHINGPALAICARKDQTEHSP